MRASRLWRIFAMLLALSLVAAACGDDDDSGTATDDTSTDGGDDEPAEGEVEVATGTLLNLDDCPSGWSETAGVTDDEITLYMSLPESGPVAALGGLDDGMRAWFDQMEPIDGRTVNLVSADDATRPSYMVNAGNGGCLAGWAKSANPGDPSSQPLAGVHNCSLGW